MTSFISSLKYVMTISLYFGGIPQMASAMLPTMAARVSASAPRLTARRMASSKLLL